MSDNPYAAPQVVDAPFHSSSDAETVRKKHLGTEVSIKSIGFLYELAAFFLIVAGSGMFAEEKNGPVYSALFVVLAVLYGFTGFAIRRFRPWTRWVAAVLSIPGLIVIPLGTIISIYFFYLLVGRKGAMVFSAPYQLIIASTPHLKYKTSKWVWIALVALVVILGFIAIMARHERRVMREHAWRHSSTVIVSGTVILNHGVARSSCFNMLLGAGSPLRKSNLKVELRAAPSESPVTYRDGRPDENDRVSPTWRQPYGFRCTTTTKLPN